jgi:nicotinamide-nucleotide adenylyltransferase
MSMTALFIGRFQPFHRGHLDALKQISKDYGLIKIGIGSSNEKGTEKNPFPVEERQEMIVRGINSLQVETEIYIIPDINDDQRWVMHVQRIVGAFDVAFSGNPHVLSLFEQAGIKTKTQIFNLKISGTEIRRKLEKEEDVSMDIP